MTLYDALCIAKEYLHKDSGLPGDPDNYKFAKDLQYRLSKAYSRLDDASVDIDKKTICLLIESWLMVNPNRAALQWDIAKEVFRKHISGD